MVQATNSRIQSHCVHPGSRDDLRTVIFEAFEELKARARSGAWTPNSDDYAIIALSAIEEAGCVVVPQFMTRKMEYGWVVSSSIPPGFNVASMRSVWCHTLQWNPFSAPPVRQGEEACKADTASPREGGLA